MSKLQVMKSILKTIIGPRGVNVLYSLKYEILLRKKFSFVRKNKRFKNTHVGERCFILGNGPSLKDVDFKKLKGETVFTCNYIYKVDDFEDLNVNFHSLMDLNDFDMRDDVKYDPREFKVWEEMARKKPVVFVPAVGRNFIQKHKIDELLDVNYLYAGAPMPLKYNKKIDISSVMPGFSTTPQFEISIAIYMGFKYIYLLGVDSTNIISFFNTALGQDEHGLHAYKNDNTGDSNKELLSNWDMSDLLFDNYLLFRGYKALKNYCDKHDIKLVNCSSTSLINSLPRENLSDVLERDL